MLILSFLLVAGLTQFIGGTRPASFSLKVPIYSARLLLGTALTVAALLWLCGLILEGLGKRASRSVQVSASMSSAALGLVIFSLHFALRRRDLMLATWLALFAASGIWLTLLSKRRVLLVSLFLLPFACFTLVVGGIDAFAAEAVASRVLAFLFIVASLIMFVGAIWLIWSDEARSVALIASVISVLVSLVILIVQLAGFDRDVRVVLWISLAVAFGTCALVLFLRGTRIPKLATVATLLSTLIGGGLLQFWYTNQYLPTTIRPTLSVTASVEKVGRLQNRAPEKNVLALSVKILAKNTSTTRVLKLGGSVRVRGVEQPPNPDGAATDGFTKALVDAGRVPERSEPEPEPASRFVKEAKWDYLYVIPWFRERNNWIDPGHESSGQLIVYVPERKYDLIRVEADLIFATADRLRVSALVYRGEKDTGLENVWILRETSLLSRITRNQRYLHEEWWGRESPVRIYVNKTRGSSSGPDLYSDKMDRVYGITTSQSGTASLSLWEKP